MKKGIVSILLTFAGMVAGIGITSKKLKGAIDKAQKLSDKHLALFLMMNQWVKIKQEGKYLSSYFKKKGLKKIAIYGMSYAGERLLDELTGSGIDVSYGIDKNADELYADIEILKPDDLLGSVDAVVVTSIYFMDEIEEKLSAKMNCPVLSLEDILYEV